MNFIRFQLCLTLISFTSINTTLHKQVSTSILLNMPYLIFIAE